MFQRGLGGSSRMAMYNVSEVRNNDTYSIDGAALNSQVASQNLEHVEFMYKEGVPEFVVDQNIYYPAATNYGYYCTGFEPPGEWEEHNRNYGLEGRDIHYTGVQNENVPYVYYNHSYGYAQFPYNPYSPYIPGAMLRVDGSLVGAQQYYTHSPYQNPVSSPAYVSNFIQPDITPNNSLSYFFEDLSVNKPDGRGSRHNFASSSNPFGRHSSKAVGGHSLPKMLEGPRPNTGVMQASANGGGVSAHGFLSSASSNVFKDAGSKVQSKVHMEKAMVNMKGSCGTLFEQNRGPRTNRSRNQLILKSYGASMGGASEQESIVIYADQYNRDDFLFEYKNAKFFVIKSYSEDDVHKSIKYNVWSSTLHGNKKLDNAYMDAQTIGGESGGCPIFLFFSVNASGQFCGVAEMVGPVDYGKDMVFWQQDKWNSCFPVKWHIIKDVSNGSFRHIVLENNENKPVTNSRDTQEIMFRKGLEMLKVFKSHTLKTSILDDFMYYENREKIILEEKTKLLGRSFERPVSAPALDSRKLNFHAELPHRVGEEVSHNDPNSFKQLSTSTSEKVSSNCDVTDAKLKSENGENVAAYKDNQLSNLKIGSFLISSKNVETNPSPLTSAGVDNTELIDFLTVGSMSVKLNGFNKTSATLAFRTFPFDPRPLQPANTAASPKNAS